MHEGAVLIFFGAGEVGSDRAEIGLALVGLRTRTAHRTSWSDLQCVVVVCVCACSYQRCLVRGDAANTRCAPRSTAVQVTMPRCRHMSHRYGARVSRHHTTRLQPGTQSGRRNVTDVEHNENEASGAAGGSAAHEVPRGTRSKIADTATRQSPRSSARTPRGTLSQHLHTTNKEGWLDLALGGTNAKCREGRDCVPDVVERRSVGKQPALQAGAAHSGML